MSAIFAPPPPPPPPAEMTLNVPRAAPITNITNSETYGCQSATTSTPASKSQLLIDIEKGVTLKQRPKANLQSAAIKSQNGLSNNSMDDPVKNLLQAELCSTLKRRQNGQNKKPNFVMSKNSTINAIKNQLKVLDAVEKPMSSEGESSSENHTNGSSSNILPLPVRVTTLPRPKTNTPADTNKPKLMISHGRPNFVRPDPKIGVPPQYTNNSEPTPPNLNFAVNGNDAVKLGQLQPISSIEPTLPNKNIEDSTPERSPRPIVTKTMQTAKQEHCGTGHNKTSETNGLDYFEAVQDGNITKSNDNEETVKYTNGASTIKTNGAHYSNTTVNIFIELSHSTPQSARSSPVLASASPLSPRKVIGFKQQDALTSQNITALKAADKRRISDSSTATSSSITASDCAEQNEIQRKLQSLRSVDKLELQTPTRKWTAKKIYGSQSPSLLMTATSPLPPRKAHTFKMQTQPQSPHITSPAIHHLAKHGSPNFDVRPIVSFSKDLCEPNRYPDQVAVSVSTKVSNSCSSTRESNTYFSDLKFIINENGDVI